MLQRARTLFEDSLRRAQQAGITIALVFALEGFARLLVRQEQFELAAQSFAWADALRDKIGDHRPPVEQASIECDLTIVHSRLDDAVFENAYKTGRAMTQDEAIACVLSGGEET